MTQAKINFGVVRHRRLRPVDNAFGYGVFTISIPMRTRAKEPDILRKNGVGDNHWGLCAFFDKDHGTGDEDSLAWIEKILAQNDVTNIDGEIWLHTFPRVLGYVFNPVSFWICTKANGKVGAVLAEVNNTFGERHCYLLHKSSGEELRSGETLTSKKVFHVSPFCEVRGEYHFRFLFPDDSRSGGNSLFRIELYEDDLPLINTSISGTGRALSQGNVILALLRYPLMSLGVIFRIHWQALKLWIKGVPFHSKPEPPELEVSK